MSSAMRLLPFRAGRLKALGVTSEMRIPELSEVPAIAETIPGFHFKNWFAVAAPPKTPPEIVAKLSQAIAEVLRLPDVAQKFREFSVTGRNLASRDGGLSQAGKRAMA